MDIGKWNSDAWDREVASGSRWTIPVTPEVIAEARKGRFEIVLTPLVPVPQSWFPPLKGLKVLGLAAAGGQQSPVLAAAGAEVTVFDNSHAQLDRDRQVADREGLTLRYEQGDMADLSRFEDESFDLVFHPSSNTYVPDVNPVWRECHRVLRPEGTLLSGFVNPLVWIFDDQAAEKEKRLIPRHSIPYSDVESLSEDELKSFTDRGLPLCFGHSLEDLIGGQLAAGFVIEGFFEDRFQDHPIDEFIASMIATRARKR